LAVLAGIVACAGVLGVVFVKVAKVAHDKFERWPPTFIARLMEITRKMASGMFSRMELVNASGLVPEGRSRDSIALGISGMGRGWLV
jgi:hypothetical protein